MTIDNVGQAIKHLKSVAVDALKADFPFITVDNIMNDLIYSAFFASILKQTKNDLHGTHVITNREVVKHYLLAIRLLLRLIENKQRDWRAESKLFNVAN
jgi:hypothetical protein